MERLAIGAVGIFFGLSLVAAPVTMADWSQQAGLSVNPTDPSSVREDVPVLQFDELPADAQRAVQAAIESPDGRTTVYGAEDAPDRFFYSDYSAPGQGLYVVVYEGQYYRLTTYAAGGFPFVYWLYELPFVVYGLLLSAVAVTTTRGERSARLATVATGIGVGFHGLGPEFDFPLLSPMTFVGLGVIATLGLGGWLLVEAVESERDSDGGGPTRSE